MQCDVQNGRVQLLEVRYDIKIKYVCTYVHMYICKHMKTNQMKFVNSKNENHLNDKGNQKQIVLLKG